MNSVLKASCLKYSEYGNPPEVLEIHQEEIRDVKNTEILVRILAASINPADIKTVQGKYPVEVTFPATGGNEWVGDVIQVGGKIQKFRPGDRVVPLTSGLGAWRSHAKFQEKDLLKISRKISIPQGATLTVNPCTAYRMLKDFVKLRPGDVVIQNGANSAVGQAVHQLCKIWNIKSIGIVRNRPDIEDLRKYLIDLGATAVLTEEELNTTDIFALVKPKLGLNCVGGKSAEEIIKQLANKGVLITYGNLSEEPMKISAAELIYRDLKFAGFWRTQWSKDNFNNPERMKMFNELCRLMENGLFKAPVHEMVPLDQYKKAMQAAIDFKGFNGKKFILDFTCLQKECCKDKLQN